MQTGALINGANAVTPISIPFGSAKEIGFACDNGLQETTMHGCGSRSMTAAGTCTIRSRWTAPRARP